MNTAALLITETRTIEIIDLGDALLVLETWEIAFVLEIDAVNDGSASGTPLACPAVPLLAAAC